MKKKKASNQVIFANITIGLQLAITIFIFVYAGNWLDIRYNTSPIFLAVGTILGMGIGFYHMMMQLGSQNSKEENEENHEERKRVKWN